MFVSPPLERMFFSWFVHPLSDSLGPNPALDLIINFSDRPVIAFTHVNINMNISISKIAIAGLAAVGATTFAIFAASGSSSTSARRFLLRSSIKTVAYATKVYSSHRLKNTVVDCARINQILTDSEGCVYGPGNENTGCILGVTIAYDGESK